MSDGWTIDIDAAGDPADADEHFDDRMGEFETALEPWGGGGGRHRRRATTSAPASPTTPTPSTRCRCSRRGSTSSTTPPARPGSRRGRSCGARSSPTPRTMPVTAEDGEAERRPDADDELAQRAARTEPPLTPGPEPRALDPEFPPPPCVRPGLDSRPGRRGRRRARARRCPPLSSPGLDFALTAVVVAGFDSRPEPPWSSPGSTRPDHRGRRAASPPSGSGVDGVVTSGVLTLVGVDAAGGRRRAGRVVGAVGAGRGAGRPLWSSLAAVGGRRRHRDRRRDEGHARRDGEHAPGPVGAAAGAGVVEDGVVGRGAVMSSMRGHARPPGRFGRP